MLQLKCLGVPSLEAFPFPSPPDAAALRASVQLLLAMGALLPSAEPNERGETLTDLGRLMARLPLGVRFAKMVILAYRHSAGAIAASAYSARSVTVGAGPTKKAAAALKQASRFIQYVLAMVSVLGQSRSPFLSASVVGDGMRGDRPADSGEAENDEDESGSADAPELVGLGLPAESSVIRQCLERQRTLLHPLVCM